MLSLLALAQMEKILLDYDEDSVVTTYDQTADEKSVFKGVEVRSPHTLLSTPLSGLDFHACVS